MSPDVTIALHNLDDRTPAFFVEEMWARGDPKTLLTSQWILSSLEGCKAAVGVLRSKLKINYVADDDV